MPTENTPGNPLELSDEDFLKLNHPPAVETAGESGESDQDESGTNNDLDSDVGKNDEKSGDDNENSDGGDGAGESDSTGKDDEDQGEDAGTTSIGENTGEGGNLSSKDKLENKSGENSENQGGKDTPPDYKAFYEKVMAPLKANGKTIEIKTPEEAIQLQQMGANYTQKMQAIAPHRKILLMLENNGLLDEGKLSFLIDVEKKNPEAIKKLIKDAGIDPLDIDLDDPQAKPYLEGNHRVTDEEAGFRTVLDELSSNPEGKATLQAITLWDQASKEVLWKQPDVMQLIHQQRESGIYDRINTELERQRALGQIPPTVPFLHAYKAIGDQLAAVGGFDDLVKPAPNSQQQTETKTPVATTVAKPKSAVKNGDKANAASSTRSNPREAKTVINPLALSDDDFMKEVAVMQGRL